MPHYENITNKGIWRYVNLLSYKRCKPATYFGNFLVNKTNRRTEFQFYWYYNSTCFEQSFCPSSGVLSRTQALVQFMQFCDRVLPGAGWKKIVSVTFVAIFSEVFFEGYITRTTKPIYFLFYILTYIVYHIFETDCFIIGLVALSL
jgi:hypothetical protein